MPASRLNSSAVQLLTSFPYILPAPLPVHCRVPPCRACTSFCRFVCFEVHIPVGGWATVDRTDSIPIPIPCLFVTFSPSSPFPSLPTPKRLPPHTKNSLASSIPTKPHSLPSLNFSPHPLNTKKIYSKPHPNILNSPRPLQNTSKLSSEVYPLITGSHQCYFT